MSKENIIQYNKILYRFVFVGLVLAMFVLWRPHAYAKIVAEGDQEFKDDIQVCLNTYRNKEGIVGDVIKELENSKNTHKISESPDWENSANDVAKANDGTGTGSHSRVSKEELEKIKKSVPELANKDFCTALLHELWHAVEADRGQWSDTKKDGVWEDEIQATIFQNFIHAIRGVDARTKYGGVDISKYLGLSEDSPKVETPTSPSAPPPSVTAPPPSALQKISVIQYQSKYIPVSQLIVENEGSCGDHWHAASGAAVATNGTQIPDPGPPCGYGATATTPVQQIESGGVIKVCGLPGGPACPKR